MAQALIKSISNNKPAERCTGSGLELAVRWRERGTRCCRRVKRELRHGGAVGADGGEGLIIARAWGHSDIYKALAGSGGSPQALAEKAEPTDRVSTLLRTVSAVGLKMKWLPSALDEGCTADFGVLVPGAEAEGETHPALLENAGLQSLATPCWEHRAYLEAAGKLSHRAGFFLDGAKHPVWIHLSSSREGAAQPAAPSLDTAPNFHFPCSYSR